MPWHAKARKVRRDNLPRSPMMPWNTLRLQTSDDTKLHHCIAKLIRPPKRRADLYKRLFMMMPVNRISPSLGWLVTHPIKSMGCFLPEIFQLERKSTPLVTVLLRRVHESRYKLRVDILETLLFRAGSESN